MRKLFPFLVCAFSFVGGCATALAPPPVVIAVGVSPATASVPPGQTGQFTATVSNDTANKGVTWSVSCSAAQCGSVSPSATASGAPTTYTAPAAPASNLTVTITAASVTDGSKTATATITVPALALTVAVTPPSATVPVQGTQAFTATVSNDASNKGVSWTLTQGGANCSPGCGTIAPATTASGSAATYTAPASVPANANVTIVATSVADANITGTATATVTASIAVQMSPSTATVDPGLTGQFTATVSNDTANKGVTWSVSCSAAQCGGVSLGATPSGVPTTYTAPVAPASNLTVTITAASVTDGNKTATATITVPALTVVVTPPSATVPVQGTQAFTATVSNDASNKGVSWTLTQGGANCSPSCGTIAPATTASGGVATYTAPAGVPANANVTIMATSVVDANISATATATISGVAISVSPTTASVNVNGTRQFTATVTNDVNNKGVSWTLTQSGTPCSPSCGTINPASTVSGVATTYTAPASVPAPAQVTLTAASVADSTKSANATVTVTPPISVSVSPATASVLVGTTQQFTAAVSNDAINGGVSWSLTQSGTSCSPACGTVSPGNTPSGTPVTYTAPSGVPSPAGVTITATSVTDTTKSASALITVTGPCGTGSEVLLNGQYAFLLQGFDASGPVAIAGSFDADGAGNIAKTVGVEDINRASGAQTNLSIVSAGSSYSVGSDQRGCMTLVNSAGTTTILRFALGSVSGTPGVASKGRIIEFDDATGTGTRVASGEIRLQDPSSFSNAQFSGPYTFGFYGQDDGGARFAVAGTFTSNGSGQVTGGTFDQDEGGTVTSDVPITGGAYNIASNGRGTIGITAIGVTNNFAIYMIDSSEAFFASTDSLTFDPIFSGEAVGSAATPFTPLSLNGSAVLHLSGDSSKSGSNAVLALATADGLGNLTSFQIFQDTAGTFTSQTTTGTYAVEPNGRVTLSAVMGLNSPLVLYLNGQNQGFALGTGAFSEMGRMEPQSGGPFSNSSFSGAYFFGVETPAHPLEEVEVGTLTANGSAGTVAVTSDQANIGSGVLAPDQTANYTFTFSADGTGNIGPGTTAIFISSSRLVYMANTQFLPSVIVIEK